MNILDLHRYFSSTELASIARLGEVTFPRIEFGRSAWRSEDGIPLGGDAVDLAEPQDVRAADCGLSWHFKKVSLS